MSKNTQRKDKIEDTKEVSNKTEIPSDSGSEQGSEVVTPKVDARLIKGFYGREYGDRSTKRVRPWGSGPLAYTTGQQDRLAQASGAKAGVATVGKKARKTLISSLNRTGKGDRFAAAVIATKKMDSIINKRKAKQEKPVPDEEDDEDKPVAERTIVQSSSASSDLAPMKRARSNTIRKRR